MSKNNTRMDQAASCLLIGMLTFRCYNIQELIEAFCVAEPPNTTRKQAFGPPQKYQYGDELVPMVV